MPDMSHENTSNFDSLTGLPNRYGGANTVEVHSEKVGVENLTAIAFELLSFGKINDSIGTKLGDKVLKLMTKRMHKVYPDALTFYRTHGDQFFLLFHKDEDLIEEMLKLFDFVQRPFAIRGEVVVLTVRAGLVRAGHALESSDDLIHAAELALHHAKHSVEKAVSYKSSMLKKSKSKYEIANDLRVALVNNSKQLHEGDLNNEFIINYQPIIEIQTSKIVEFEAQLAWQHPKRGIMSSKEFDETADEIGAARTLDIWLIERACKHAVHWNLENDDNEQIGVRINIHMAHFLQKGLLSKILNRSIERAKIDPTLIHLGVRELQSMPRKVYDILREVKQLGCKITLDNFGEGSTSISELTGFPFDCIKTDRSFIQDLGSHIQEKAEYAYKVASAVNHLTVALKTELICNNVQSELEFTLLKKIGVTHAQGDYFGEALSVLDLKQFTNKQKQR